MAKDGAHTDFRGEMSYGDYLRLDALLSAQAPLSGQHDELLFIVMHQVKELWLKLLGHELDAAIAAIRADTLRPAFKHLARCGRVQEQRQRLPRAQANQLSVRVELQADCFAGIWAAHTRQAGVLEDGDIEEAMNAASAIGDDRLQKQAGGRVVPDSFTHGSSAQRMRWFKRGYDTGRVQACDTFQAERL